MPGAAGSDGLEHGEEAAPAPPLASSPYLRYPPPPPYPMRSTSLAMRSVVKAKLKERDDTASRGLGRRASSGSRSSPIASAARTYAEDMTLDTSAALHETPRSSARGLPGGGTCGGMGSPS